MSKVQEGDEDMTMEELIKKIELILIITGQHDCQFKLGEVIKYSPSEVRNILMVHISELEEVANSE